MVILAAWWCAHGVNLISVTMDMALSIASCDTNHEGDAESDVEAFMEQTMEAAVEAERMVQGMWAV